MGNGVYIAGSLSGTGGSFIVQGPAAGRDFVVTGTGFSVQRCWLKVTAGYTLQSSGSQTSHTGSGAVEVRW